MIKTFYLFNIKSWINRWLFYPRKTSVIFIVVLISTLIPLFYVRNRVLEFNSYFYSAFFACYFIYIALNALFLKNENCKMTNNFYTILQIIPSSKEKIHNLLIVNKFLTSLLRYCLLCIIIISPSFHQRSLGDGLSFFIVLSLLVAIKTIVAELSDMLSYSSKNNLVRIMLGVFLIIHAVYLFVIWRLPNYVHFFSLVPAHIFSDALRLLMIFNQTSINTTALIGILSKLVLLLVIGLIILKNIQRLYYTDNINYFSLSDKQIISSNISLVKLHRALFWIPSQISIYTAKEVLQIIREKKQLLGTLLISLSFLLFLGYLNTSLGKYGVFFAFTVASHNIAFSLVKLTILRDIKTLWIYKTTNIKWRLLIIGKFLGCYLVSFLCIVFVALIYISILAVFREATDIASVTRLAISSLILLLPGSIGFGLLIAALFPYQVMEIGNDVTYRQNSTGDFFSIISLLLVALPATIIMLSSTQDIARILLLFCEGLLILIAIRLTEKKLKSI